MDHSVVLVAGFADELSKLADASAREVEAAADQLEDEAEKKSDSIFGKIKQYIARTLKLDVEGDTPLSRAQMGAQAYALGANLDRAAASMLNFPGPASQDQQYSAIVRTLQDHAPLAMDPLDPVNVTFQGYGPSSYEYLPKELAVTIGQLGSAYHEAGHGVSFDKLQGAGLSTSALLNYLKAYDLSAKYGPMAGAIAAAPVLFEKREKPSALARAAPVAALLPSLPMLVEEGRASYYGGRSALKAGEFLPFLRDVGPSTAHYIARAGAIPFALYMVNRMRKKRAEERDSEDSA
jgi:hypothetical protein